MPILGKHHKRHQSELDRFLEGFEKQRQQEPKAREAEIEKHQRIAQKRDKADTTTEDKLWEDF